MDSEAPVTGSWKELLGHRFGGVSAVLAGGVVLFATNVYVTTSLLPNAVADIGGRNLYAWAMTVFLLAAVITSMLVSRTLQHRGSRRAYLIGFALFGAGTALCALAPSMVIMLGGRAVQGLGGGLLAGLGFAVLRTALPERLWARGIGLVSAMWGVGNVVGPVLGGVFAQLGLWRGAFWFLLAVTALAAWLARRFLPRSTTKPGTVQPVPVLPLVVLSAATAAVSVAGVVPRGPLTAVLIATSAAMVVCFVLIDRKARAKVLPTITYERRSVLPWIYLSVVVLAIGSTTETFIPLFGQTIGHMSPLVAGLLGAAISWGWSAAQIISSNVQRASTIRRLRIAGPFVLGIGLLGYGALQLADPSAVVLVAWFVVLFAAGTGIGVAFPHLATAAMSSTGDESESQKAAAGISTVQLMSNAFGSALAGLLVSFGEPSMVSSARFLTVGFAVIAGVGIAIAVRSLKRRARTLAVR